MKQPTTNNARTDGRRSLGQRGEDYVAATLCRAGYSILRLNREDFHPTAIQRTRASLCEFLDTPPRAIPRRLARYLAEPSVPQP